MKKRIFQTAVASVLAGALLTAGMPMQIFAASEAKQDDYSMYIIHDGKKYYTGLSPEDAKNKTYDQLPASLLKSAATASLPSNVDLSTSKYFPPIRNQGALGTCVPFSTVYYQYTYEVAKLNNLDAKNNTKYQYSPQWTSSLLYHDNWGVKANNFEILKMRGGITMDQMPYSNSSDMNNWYNDEAGMFNALKTRLSSYSDIALKPATPEDPTPITSNKDEDLNGVKAWLASGHVAGTGSGCFDGVYMATQNGRGRALVAGNMIPGKSGHAITIVGYDDDITCDINRNGSIETFEKGAFKLANSWGTGWENDGYIWVMYDALNLVSAGGSGAVTTPYPRHALLVDYQIIEVANYSPKLVASLTIPNPSTRGKTELYLGISDKTGEGPSVSRLAYTAYPGGSNLSEFTVMLDFYSIFSNYTGDIISSKWYAGTKGIASSIKYKLRDAKYNLISSTTFAGSTTTPVLAPLIFAPIASNVYTIDPYSSGQPCYISNIEPGTSQEAFRANLTAGGGVSLFDTSGGYLEGNLCTGSSAYQFCYGIFMGEYYNAVKGDVNGDGKVDAVDFMKVRQYLMDPAALQGVYLKAGDVNGSGSVDSVDAMLIQKYMATGQW